jgi:hypothetical protein
MARGKKTGGRKLGTLNKATIERALIAELDTAETKASGRKLAKETLEDFMHTFVQAAQGFRERGDLDKFREWATLAIECAKALAPFQSPRLSALAVGAAVVNKIEVVGGLPDDQDGSFNPVPTVVAPESVGGSIAACAEGCCGEHRPSLRTR